MLFSVSVLTPTFNEATTHRKTTRPQYLMAGSAFVAAAVLGYLTFGSDIDSDVLKAKGLPHKICGAHLPPYKTSTAQAQAGEQGFVSWPQATRREVIDLGA